MNQNNNDTAPAWLKTIVGIGVATLFIACILSGAQNGFENPKKTQAREKYERSLLPSLRARQSLGKPLSEKEAEILRKYDWSDE